MSVRSLPYTKSKYPKAQLWRTSNSLLDGHGLLAAKPSLRFLFGGTDVKATTFTLCKKVSLARKMVDSSRPKQ